MGHWIPTQLLRSVVPLGLPADTKTRSFQWTGTAFLVAAPDGRMQQGVPTFKPWLVTARHLLEGKNFIVIGFNSSRKLQPLCFPVNFDKNVGWHAYSRDDTEYGDVDIAVIPLQHEFLQHYGIELPSLRLDTNLAESEEISPGQPIMGLGYPLGLVAVEDTLQPNRFLPIVRQGLISRVPWINDDRTNSYLVDLMDSRGNSGGPILLGALRAPNCKRERFLAGILSGFIPDFIPIHVNDTTEQELIFLDPNQQTVKPVIRQNSGLARVESINHVASLVNSYPYSKIGLSFTDALELGLV